jgi:hypothetical protein
VIGSTPRHRYRSQQSQQWSLRYALLTGATLIDSILVSIMRGHLPVLDEACCHATRIFLDFAEDIGP